MLAVSERDERAVLAHASNLAAGVIFAAPDGAVLLLCRSAQEANYGGHWALPGGKGEPGETPWMIACREADEEIGSANRHAWVGEPTIVEEVPTPNGMVFTTFVQPVRYRFVPEIDGEHCGYVWATPDALPAPMHPQVARVLGMLFPEGAEDAKWITVKPNGPNATGKAVQITENGTITKGMGGKFNGQNISEANKAESPQAASKPEAKGSGQKLSSREKAYVESYSGDGFLDTNKKLRAGEKGGPEVEAIDAAIAKSDLSAGTKLYRGMSKEAARALFSNGTVNKGDVISDKAFLSTSTNEKFTKGSFGLGGVVFEITAGEGQKGLNMEGLTRNSQESEVLLPRNTKLRVDGIVPPKSPGQPIVIRVTSQ